MRNQATVGGVLADADYASDPPAMFAALDARAVLRSTRGERDVAMEELILGHYETCIAPDELLVEVRVPAQPERAVYRKFRARSAEDRPCVAVAAARGEGRCASSSARWRTPRSRSPTSARSRTAGRSTASSPTEIGRRYAERIEPIADARGSAAYRRRITAVEVRRAVEELA